MTSALQFTQNLTATPTSAQRRAEILADPGFGKHFTDHMVTATWTPDAGWHDAGVVALRPDRARPGGRRAALRAGDLRGPQGLPARRRPVWAFRPEANGARLRPLGQAPRAAGAARRGLPRERSTLLVADRPRLGAVRRRRQSLYLRPFMFATEAFLGVRPAHEVTYLVIASPGRRLLRRRHQAGVDLAVVELHPRRRSAARARPSAAATTPRAWSPSSRPPTHGCDQVLLPRRGRAQVGRGARRHEPLLRVRRRPLVTPALTGTILEGITRVLDHHARQGARPRRSRSAASTSTSGATASRRPDHRGVRLRHGRRHHPGRAARVGRRRGRVAGRHRGRRGRGDRRGSGRRSSTSSTAAAPTPTAGCAGSPEPAPRCRTPAPD